MPEIAHSHLTMYPFKLVYSQLCCQGFADWDICTLFVSHMAKIKFPGSPSSHVQTQTVQFSSNWTFFLSSITGAACFIVNTSKNVLLLVAFAYKDMRNTG